MSANTEGLEIERVHTLEALELLKEDWNALLDHNETKTVELTYEWQTTYWKHFHEDSELFVLRVKDVDSTVAIAPFRLTFTRTFGARVRILEFIAAKESNYQDFIVGDDKEKALTCIVDYLIDNQGSWDVLSLRHVPEASSTGHFFLNGSAHSLLSSVEIGECLFLRVDRAWEEYAAESKKPRKKVDYYARRLGRHGDVSCFHCSNEAQLRSNLGKFFELHRRRWDQTESLSQFNDERYRDFYLEVSSQLLPKRQVDLFVLEVNSTPVALLYSFVLDRDYLTQLLAWDIRYAKCSPSVVMHELFVKEAFADDVKIIDFGHYFRYKEYYWADCRKSRLNIRVYSKGITPRYVYAATATTSSLRAHLKKVAPLRRLVRYLRHKVR